MKEPVMVVRLSPVQRQLSWMLMPIAAGIITGFDVLANGSHPSWIFSWSIVTFALTPGLVKAIRYQLRTRDGFWLSQSISTAGSIVTTAASYVGLWVGAAVVIGLVELYTNPAAPSGTIALASVVTVLAPFWYRAWRKAGRRT